MKFWIMLSILTPKPGIQNIVLIINWGYKRQPFPPVHTLFTVLSFFWVCHCFCLFTSKPYSTVDLQHNAMAQYLLTRAEMLCVQLALTATLIGLDLPPRPSSFIYFHANRDFWCWVIWKASLRLGFR